MRDMVMGKAGDGENLEVGVPYEVPDGGWDCFVAHADPDSAAAELLAEYLRAREPGLGVFEDSMLPVGSPWGILQNHLKASKIIIVLGTEHSAAAHFQKEEIASAISLFRAAPDRHRIVPVYIGPQSELTELYGLQSFRSVFIDGLDDLGQAADQVLDSLRDLRGQGSPAAGHPRLPEREYHRVRLRYVERMFLDWRHIDLRSLGSDQSEDGSRRTDIHQLFPLDELYISLYADPRSPADRERAHELFLHDYADLGFDRDRSGLTVEEIIEETVSRGSGRGMEPIPDADDGGDDVTGVPLVEAFRNHRVLILRGGPGSGKSVLCQWLGGQLAAAVRDGTSGELGRPRVPLWFRLADYAEYYAERLDRGQPPGDVVTFLADTLTARPERRVPECSREQLEAMLAQALDVGEAVILIDGLDEVTAHRELLSEAIVRFVLDRVPPPPMAGPEAGNQVVITSRIAGYDAVSIPLSHAAHYVIRPMTRDQITQFATNFFRTVYGSTDAVGRLLDRLFAGSNPALANLARIPLLLASICLLWYRDGNLPGSRSAIYRKLIVDMAARWRELSNGKPPELTALLGQDEQVLGMLADIAVVIHEHYPSGSMPEARLLSTVERTLLGQPPFSGVDPRALSVGLLELIKARVNVLAEIGQRAYGFSHLTFEEYLAGLTLVPRSIVAGTGAAAETGAVAEMARIMTDRLGDSRWREPLLLALGGLSSGPRTALMRYLLDRDDLDLDLWADVCLAAILEGSPEAVANQELSVLTRLLFTAYRKARKFGEARADLELGLADLRRQFGPDTFDPAALRLLGQRPDLAPVVAYVYWRRRWLTDAALDTFAAHGYLDSSAWGWPMHRALQHAVAPADSPDVTIQRRLRRPPDDDPGARLYDLGYQVWALERHRRREEVTGQAGPGALPVRDFFLRHPERWELCIGSPSCAAAIVVLAGGLDYRDILRGDSEYSDLADLLRLGETTLEHVMRDTAVQLVPRFGTGDFDYAIANYLIKSADRLLLTQAPPPMLDASLLARPVGPHITAAILGWASAPDAGDQKALRSALTSVIDSTADEHERADARLALRFLPEQPPLPGQSPNRRPASASAPGRSDAGQWAGDAALRGHRQWFQAVWQTDNGLTSAERAAMHRWLLCRFCAVAGRPVNLSPAPGLLSASAEAAGEGPAPILVADSLGRVIRGLDPDARGGAFELEYPPDSLAPWVIQDALASMPLLPHWPGHRRNFPLGDSGIPGRDAAQSAGLPSAGLVETARQLVAYLTRKEPEWARPLAAFLFGALRPYDLGTPAGLEAYFLALETGPVDPAAVVADGQTDGLTNIEIGAELLAAWRSYSLRPALIATLSLARSQLPLDRLLSGPELLELVDAEPSPRRRLSAYHFLASNDLVRTDGPLLDRIAACAEAAPAESVRAALDISALTRHDGAAEHWHLRALALLEAEREGQALAEALFRLRHLGPHTDRIERRQRELADRIGPAFLRADAVGDHDAALLEILRVADVVPMPSRVSLTVASTILEDGESSDGTRPPEHAALHYDLLGGDDFSGAEADAGDASPLELATVIELELAIKDAGGTTPAMDEALAAASAVDARALPRLERLIAGSPPESPWLPPLRRLAALQRVAAGSREPRHYLDLVELAATGDSRTACTAVLQLLGPYRAIERKHRRYQLSRHGADLWWELGTATVGTDREASHRHRLLVGTLYEWDIDDAGELAGLIGRAGDEASQPVWSALIEACGLWRPGPQAVLARWLATGRPSAAIIDAALILVATHLQAEHELDDELVQTVLTLAAGQPPAMMVPNVANSTESRLKVARVVSEACCQAMELSPGASQRTLADARSLFRAAAEPVLTADADAAWGRLNDYGALNLVKLGAGPETVWEMIDDALNSVSGVELLADWVLALDRECPMPALGPVSPLDYAEAETVLSALMVVSLRHPLAFLTHCQPEVFQPVLSRIVVHAGSSIRRQAAMILLGCLRCVDLEPRTGPTLTAVIESALTDASPGVEESALIFMRRVRHVRGGSLVGSLLELARNCPNETVAWGYARLAEVRVQTLGSSGPDRRAVRALLRGGLNSPAHRRLAFLVGTGSHDDPIKMMVRGHLDTELQRLARPHLRRD